MSVRKSGTSTLSLVFPLLTGVLKTSIPIISQRLNFKYRNKLDIFWLPLFISIAILFLCVFYFVVVAVVCKINFSSHCKQLRNDFSRHPFIIIVFLSGFIASTELALLTYVCIINPYPSISLMFTGLSQGQFITSLILDISGIWAHHRVMPSDAAATGGGLLFLGTVMLQMQTMSNIIKESWAFYSYLVALLVGAASFISQCFSRRFSYSCGSYW